MTKMEAEELWTQAGQWVSRGLKVSGAIGFLVSVTYFLRIGSLPVDNISSLLSLGSVIALISIASFFVLIVYWALPTLAFHALIDQIGGPAKAWFLSPSATGSASSSDSQAMPGEPYRQEFPAPAAGRAPADEQSASVGGPAGKVRTSASWEKGDRHLAMWCLATVALPWTLNFAYFAEEKYEALKRASDIAATLSFVLAVCVIGSYALSRAPEEPEPGIVGKRLGLAGLVLFLNTFPLFIFLSSLNASDFAGKLDPWPFVGLLASGIMLTALGQFLALTGSIKEKAAGVKGHVGHLVVSAVMVIFGLYWLSAWAHVEDNVMVAASVRVPSVKLAIAKPGCQALASLGLAPALPASGAKSYESGCSLAPVEVLSRLGSRWQVRCLEPDRDATVEPINLKGDDVLNFIAVDPPPKLDKPAASKSKPHPTAKTFGSCRAIVPEEALVGTTAAAAMPASSSASATGGNQSSPTHAAL